jgi:DNA modification methylase
MHLPDTIERLPIATLLPYARNSRTHSPAQVAAVAKSIQEFGFTNPVLIKEDGTIIAGHGRVMAARQMGLADVPCIRLSHLTDEQARAYVIADNKLAELAGWDKDLLTLEMRELQDFGFDMALTGFSDAELAALLFEPATGKTDPDDAPPVPDVVHTKPGDLWLLGKHRVMCGDSTHLAQLETLMGGGIADMVWTDPPYGVSYVGKTKDALTIENDSLDDAGLEAFLRDCFTGLLTVCRAGGGWYVAAPARPLHHCFSTVLKELEIWRQTLNWVKSVMVLGRSDYHYRHEPIFYGWKPGAAHQWFSDRKQTTVLSFDKPFRNAEHPTMKPVELIEYCVGNSSEVGAVVLDPFGGSGSTLIACEKNGRIARLMELDPKYCDVIVKRWINFTGQSAVLESTGQPFPNV